MDDNNSGDNVASEIDSEEDFEEEVRERSVRRNLSYSSGTSVERTRRKNSWIWNHCTEDKDAEGRRVAKCNHCGKTYKYGGSTSTIQSHLKKCQSSKVMEYFKQSKGTSDSKKIMSTYVHNKTPYARSHKACQKQDKLIARSIIRNLQPLYLLESKEYLDTYTNLDPRYTLPSRSYMLLNVILPMYTDTHKLLKDKLSSVSSIALTTDCWTCLANHSYMTITCHIINEEMVLENFVLDTQGMKKKTH